METKNKTIAEQYKETILTLNSLQKNHSAIITDSQWEKPMMDIRRYLSCLNIQLDYIDRLNVIHVAGTKGKGSTCAFTESILRQYGYKTGFYSSPHLVEVRERIRINGLLLSKEKFIHYFWQCYNSIDEAVQQRSNDEDPLCMPFYFSFLTTMMFYVFVHEQIDVAIIEVGFGGEYDCTNIIKNPIVCGITSLGLDHVKLLGNTIDKIAWHKAGIFKKHIPAVTVLQMPKAMHVLYERAEEKQCTLTVAPTLNQYSNYPFRLALDGDIQEVNASLAVQLVFRWLDNRKVYSYDELMRTPLSQEIRQGLAACQWAGRNEIIDSDIATYYLDGAHTIEAIEQCKNWFLNSIAKQHILTKKILVFYCSNERNPEELLKPLMTCQFNSIAFCSPIVAPHRDKIRTDLTPTDDQWRETKTNGTESDRLTVHTSAFNKLILSMLESQSNLPSVHCFPTVSHVLTWIDENNLSKSSILVTGSLYLIGAFLKLLKDNHSDT
ncbi:hypothetical protein I4U23_020428 [Adineta vaga]|nr:hypothetical protein I4U23_020428 [Adineta vaga]